MNEIELGDSLNTNKKKLKLNDIIEKFLLESQGLHHNISGNISQTVAHPV